jgi:hypothetical protein
MKTCALSIIVIGLMFPSMSKGQAQPIGTNGLVAYYPLDGNANDTSGNGRNGTPVNGVSYITQSSRYVAHFDGTSQYISLPTAISNYQDLTVTFWIRTTGSNLNSFPSGIFVISRDISGANYDWNICIEQGRKVAFQDYADEVVIPNDIAAGQWVHVACIADSVGQIKRVFVNGQQVASGSWTPHPFANNNVPIFLAASTVDTGSHVYFPGEMADVGFYNRPLSSNEVQQVYGAGLSSCVPHSASATATVVNGFVIGATITDGGCGYYSNAIVIIQGGGGTGASGVATLSGGTVTGITMTSAGSGYTSAPAIFIGTTPSVQITPQNLTAVLGGNAALAANPTVLGPFSDQIGYQWIHNGTNVPSATNASLPIIGAQLTDAGSYSVIASNLYGIATSGVATVSIVLPPVITQSPSNWVAAVGTPVTLTASATGTAPLSYQWWHGAGPISGASSSAYVLGPVQTNQAGSYFVVVSNAYGIATSAVATVTVYVPVSISVQPTDQVVPAHGVAVFNVTAGGYPAPSYQWAFNGTNLPGATVSSLVVSNVLLTNLGIYDVTVENGFSSQTSLPANLIMSPSIITPYLGTIAIWGRSAELSVSAIGSQPLFYQWFKDGVLIASATNATFSLPVVQLGDGGVYSVVVSSPYGAVTNSAQLVVNPVGTDIGMYAGITLTGAVGYSYQIQYTTDLTMTNSWSTLTNLTLEQPVQLWVDTSTNALKTPHRYYRILPGP